MLNLFRFVGLRHLRLRPARTGLTLLGVAFGIALYVAIAIINRSTLASFRESVDAVAGKATLIVSAGDAGFDEAKLDVIRAIPGVTHAAPMIETRAYFTGDRNASETLAILGVDLLQEQAVRTYKTTDEQVIDDPLVFLNQPDSIIVTHSFAKAHGLKNNSTFELATANGKKRFTVRGELSPEGPARAYGGDVAIMDIDGARATFGKDGKIDRADLITAEGADVDAVAARISHALGPGYQVERPASRSESMERVIATYQALLTVFSTLALIVGLFLVTNSVSISVAERRREIGTLRALGATRSGILALFLSEACGTGLLGALLGAWLGRVLATLMLGLVTQSISDQYMTRIEVKHLIFGAREVLLAAGVGTLAAFVAALIPAYRATRIGPLDAMRKVESPGERDSRLARVAPWAGLAGLVYFAISSLNHFASRAPAFSWLDHVCSMVGAALLGPALVTALIRWLAPRAVPAGGAVLRLASDNLLRSPRRTGSNVMTLMVGLILVTMIGTVNLSFRETIMSWFDGLFTADVLVSSVGKVINFETQPISEAFAPKLSALPGVLNGPRTGAYALRFIQIDYGGRRIGIKAVDAPDPARGYGSLPARDRSPSEIGPEFFAAKDPVVLVSRNFVLHFGLKTGDRLELDTPSGRASFRILAEIEDFASPEGVLYMPRETYKRLWRDSLVSAFTMYAKPGYGAQRLRAEVDQAFGRSDNLMAVSNAEFREQMSDIIDQSFTYTQAIKFAALLVGLLGLFNTFLISVLERTRELGMLRAVGMTRAQLARMVVFEALMQGGLGACAAVALGTYVSYLWILGSLAYVQGWIIDFHFSWTAAFATVGAGILVTALAAVFPAARAANLVIREALEYE